MLILLSIYFPLKFHWFYKLSNFCSEPQHYNYSYDKNKYILQTKLRQGCEQISKILWFIVPISPAGACVKLALSYIIVCRNSIVFSFMIIFIPWVYVYPRQYGDCKENCGISKEITHVRHNPNICISYERNYDAANQ